MHLRKLVPLADLLEQIGRCAARAPPQDAVAPGAPKPPLAPAAGSPVAPTSGAAGRTGAQPASRRQPQRRSHRRARLQSRRPHGSARTDGRRSSGTGAASRMRCSPRSGRQRLLLQHRRRAGAADRGQRRPGDVHVPADAARAARAVRADARLARGDGRAARRPQGQRRRRAVGRAPDAAAAAPSRRRRAARPPADVRPAAKRDLKAEALDVVGRAGDARGVPGGDPRRRGDVTRRRDCMNIQPMMKQAQEMQERLQKQMAELRVEATAGGGMVTVVVNGAKQLQSITIDPEVVSKDDVEMLQDLIVAARQRRPAQGRRAARAVDARPDGRPEDSRALSDRSLLQPAASMSLPDPLIRLDRAAAEAARHRRQGRAAPGVPRPQDPARGRRAAVRRDPRRQGAGHLLLDLQQHHRRRSRAPSAPSATRDQRIICVVEEPQNVSVVEKTREFRGVYHVLMGALSPLQGVGPDDLKIKGLLTRVGDGGGGRSDPGDQPDRRRRGDRALPGAAAEAARRAGDAHRDGHSGRLRSRVRRRSDDDAGDGRADARSDS